jgi:hypothetical protein
MAKNVLLEGCISNFTCARYYFLYVEFSDFYVNKVFIQFNKNHIKADEIVVLVSIVKEI